MKPILLVLCVFRYAETRSLLSEVLENAGHKLVNASGCEQARTLLENGLEPDFVILESAVRRDLPISLIPSNPLPDRRFASFTAPVKSRLENKPRGLEFRYSWSGL